MRDSLTVLAILVIGVLTAALVGPYLIDWDTHRDLIERRLSAAAGTNVVIDGFIDLKLLPTPIFKFGHVSIGSPAEGHPRVTAEEIDTEISLTALMRGEVQVIDTTIRHPNLVLAESHDGGFGLAIPAPDDADRVALDHLRIVGGSVSLALADGRRLAVSGLDMDAEATSLRGPFKATGQFGPAAGPLPFRIATGAFDGRKLAIKVHVDGAAIRPSLEFDGTLSPTAPPPPPRPKPGTSFGGPSIDGAVTVVGRLPLAGTPAAVPWRMTGHVSGDRDHAVGSDIEIRAGSDMRALIASGDGTALYAQTSPDAARPAIAVQLHGAQLDTDNLAVSPEGSPAPPRGADLLGRLLDLAGDGTAAVGLPLRLAMAAGFDTATVDRQVLLGTKLRFALGPDPTAGVAITTEGPDGARLSLDGSFEPGSAAVFRGHAAVSSPNLPRTIDAFASAAPDVAASLKSAIPARNVAAAGDLEASRVGATARNLSLRLDGTRIDGIVSYTRSVGAEPSRVFADLTSDNLDLQSLPDLSGAATLSQGVDLSLALSAAAVTFAPTATAPIDAGHLALHLTKTGDDLHLDHLGVAVGGSTIEATADRTGPEARAEARVRAAAVGPLADVLARLFPGPTTTALRDRAALLSPFDGTVSAEATGATPDGTLAPRRFSLDGTAAGTHLVAALAPDRTDDGLDAMTRSETLSLHAETQDGTVLLHQLGLAHDADPGSRGGNAASGPATLDGTARGSFAAGFDSTLTARLGETALSYRGRARWERGQGRLTLASGDLRPVLSDLGLRVPVAAAAPKTAAEVQADLGWNGAVLGFHHMAGHVAGTSLGGDISLDLTPRKPGTRDDRPVLFGQLAIERLPASSLLDLVWGAPTLPGAAAGGTAWSENRFDRPWAELPRTEIGLRVATLPLGDRQQASAVSLVLRAAAGALTLGDATGQLDGGTIGGTLLLRRDGALATMSGRVTWSDIAFDRGGVAARVSGTQDLAGSGETPAALVTSLAGSGSLTLAAATLARTDPDGVARTVAAFDKTAEAADPEAGAIDVADVGRALAAELDRGPLHLGDQTAPVTLAGGVLRAGPLQAEGQRWAAETELTLDLGGLDLASRTRLRTRETAPDRKSEAAEVVSILKGPLDAVPQRSLEAASLVNLVQARAIARAQERIDVLQQDVRERAFFNRRLKAIEADQQASLDRIRAEQDAAAAAKAEADKQRFIDNAMKGIEGARPRQGAGGRPEGKATPGPGTRGGRPNRNGDPFDLKPPPNVPADPAFLPSAAP